MATKMPYVKRVSVEQENNGETFWTEIQRRTRDGDPVAKFLNDLDDYVLLPTPEAKKLIAYAKSVPGYADGPKYAKTAIRMDDIYTNSLTYGEMVALLWGDRWGDGDAPNDEFRRRLSVLGDWLGNEGDRASRNPFGGPLEDPGKNWDKRFRKDHPEEFEK